MERVKELNEVSHGFVTGGLIKEAEGEEKIHMWEGNEQAKTFKWKVLNWIIHRIKDTTGLYMLTHNIILIMNIAGYLTR